MLKTMTQDSHQVASPSSSSTSTSSSSLHMDFLRVFKRKSSIRSWSRKNSASDSSAFSTPTSSRRSSFASQGFASVHHHQISPASSANTSPAISRQVTKNVSDYEALIQNTQRQEQADEAIRQKELQAYFNRAAETGLSLRRF
ncbi:hypothetical protein PHSY_002072 [Pseudozyma hubeiensis SY62]|uniref:Uncharacterized protein n=1 Tax=Pseudozyma hubeiensis (strain SY62) TaxID=1305764 RepID=R9P8T5_PSEHS|nr:hypothetical protein PHSY_002072 [Pseudozyma hubeiensis SY62]GAC94500.1 hypothetical protein PHSY_002072 [Pseudozyma hubeiensis SY62]